MSPAIYNVLATGFGQTLTLLPFWTVSTPAFIGEQQPDIGPSCLSGIAHFRIVRVDGFAFEEHRSIPRTFQVVGVVAVCPFYSRCRRRSRRLDLIYKPLRPNCRLCRRRALSMGTPFRVALVHAASAIVDKRQFVGRNSAGGQVVQIGFSHVDFDRYAGIV